MKIKKNSTVLIRPNANTADYPPGPTNPEVLKGALVNSSYKGYWETRGYNNKGDFGGPAFEQ